MILSLNFCVENISYFLSDTIARSVSDVTEPTVEQIPRESQGTPPPTPSTTVRQNHESCSFFGRRRRHRHHSRQPHRSRRYEVKRNYSKYIIKYLLVFLVASSTSGRPVIITDETRRQISNNIDISPQEQQPQQREHQTRIKHRSIKGQTYRLKLFNQNFIVPFDRLWLLTVFDRYSSSKYIIYPNN